MPFSSRHDDAPLVPPLQLPRRDTGQCNYITGCKCSFHLAMTMFQTNIYEMFETF